MSSSDDGPSLLGVLGVLGGLLLVSKACNSKEEERAQARRLEEEKEERKEACRRKKEEKLEKRRRNTECLFEDGISEQEFEQIVADARRHMKRVQLQSCGPVVYGTVRTQSGQSTWDFTLDFNDFGHITGRYWKTTENTDSSYPQIIAEKIQQGISKQLSPYPDSDPEWTDVDQDVYDEGTLDDCEETEEQPVISHQLKKKKRRKICCRLCTMLVLVLLCTIGIYLLHEYIPIGMSSNSLLGMPYEDVIEKLHAAGFDRIKLKELEDLNLKQRTRVGAVAEITIGEDHYFTPDTKYLSFESIVVAYHSLTDIVPSCTSKEAEKMLYTDLIEQLKKDGFTNIRAEKFPDLINGWLTKENSVKEISIAGSTKFDEESQFDPDAEIIIKYHTFKNKK